MKSKFTPIGYDKEKRSVLIPGGSCKEAFFIQDAGREFYRYGDPALLLWAIDNQLLGLMENENIREIFKLLVTGKLRKTNISSNLKSDEMREDIFARIWFHHGRGLPIYINPNSESKKESACEIAAKELGGSASNAHKIWKYYGGRKPRGIWALVARNNQIAGEAVTTK